MEQFANMKIAESIYILVRYAEVVQYLKEVMVDNKFHKESNLNKKQQYHFVTLFSHVLLDVNSFMDEFHKHFEQKAESEYKPRVQAIKRIVRPVLDRINKEWPEMARMRNEMIAHNWRDNKDKFIFEKLGNYEAPRTFHDLLYLEAYIVLIKAVILAEFDKEANNFRHYIASIRKNFGAPKANPDFPGEIRKLVQQVNDNTLAERKAYKFDSEQLMGNVDEHGHSLPID